MPVRFEVDADQACAYLADPRNRPAWQSSLRRVEQIDGEVGVGQTWVDVTTPGLRPRMETTDYQAGRRWTERGTWRRFGIAFAAELTLTFTPDGRTPDSPGCLVDAAVDLNGPFAFVIRALAPRAIAADLRRAAAALSPGPTES